MESFKDNGISYNKENSKGLSSYALISRYWKIVDFSSIKMDSYEKSWKPQEWSIAMGCQDPPRLMQLLAQTRMVVRIR